MDEWENSGKAKEEREGGWGKAKLDSRINTTMHPHLAFLNPINTTMHPT